MNYYNENDKHAAAWLRELIQRGLIPRGHVDERSIVEVEHGDLQGYTQCHFFAGIGGWSYALQLAGWPEDEPVWTGSCPCQPFSAAGKGKGTDDERHLWPEFFRLIRECRPRIVFGEQVASKDGRGWFDGVSADLESVDYAAAAADLCAAGIQSPHIRQRLYWVADAMHRDRGTGCDGKASQRSQRNGEPSWNRDPGGLGDAASEGLEGHAGDVADGNELGRLDANSLGSTAATSRPWDRYDTLCCKDGKSRRVEPGTFPLVDGLPRGMVPSCDISRAYAQSTAEERVMRLRGYGNAIVPPLAAEFIAVFMDESE